MDDLGCKILLGNTYHLNLKPTGEIMKQFGGFYWNSHLFIKIQGLHKFMNWKHNILTDSGGFQMVSLSQLCEISEVLIK